MIREQWPNSDLDPHWRLVAGQHVSDATVHPQPPHHPAPQHCPGDPGDRCHIGSSHPLLLFRMGQLTGMCVLAEFLNTNLLQKLGKKNKINLECHCCTKAIIVKPFYSETVESVT